jgi:hypothetical protein
MTARVTTSGSANGERELELRFEEMYDPDRFKQIKRMFKGRASSTKD